MSLKIFFSYFGSKWRAAPHYPAPLYRHIIEPFAGAAGYALRYHDRQVTLLDKDPVICGIWDYLINASSEEILRLPLDPEVIYDTSVVQEARNLIGFWVAKGRSAPAKTPSEWTKSGLYTSGCHLWGEPVRARISAQVASIRHWKIHNSDYRNAPDIYATWFVDPPYQKAGVSYRFSEIDFAGLSEWAKSRSGQVMVCENAGATWMPFKPHRRIKSRRGFSEEVLWYNDSIFGEGL